MFYFLLCIFCWPKEGQVCLIDQRQWQFMTLSRIKNMTSKNLYQKYRKSFFTNNLTPSNAWFEGVSLRLAILSENLKTLTSYNYPKAQYFLMKLRTRFLLTIVKEGCVEFFYFIQILSYLQKLKKTCFLHNRFLHFY